MRYGLINDEKTEATQTGQRAICPCCNTELLSRCGEFKVNHWAHVNLLECDSWQGGKTDWHIDWQDQFPKECQEIIYTDYETGEKHIADVSYNDFIFEFQHSGIKFEEIVKRTNFYQGIGKKVVWIFDYTDKEDNFNFYHWKLSNVSRIKEWKYKPKHISIMQDWDTLTLIDVGYELRLLLCDSLAIKIDNIKEIITPEFRTKLFNLQKYFHKDILEKQQKAAAQILNNYYDDENELIELRKELEILKINHNIKEFELENLSKKYDGLQIQYQIILEENNSLKKNISASTYLFSYS
jgi:competence CoiA-like predicted nuclease